MKQFRLLLLCAYGLALAAGAWPAIPTGSPTAPNAAYLIQNSVLTRAGYRLLSRE
jgi:hypothetical protein